MAHPTKKHPYFFSPLPCYSSYDANDPDRTREHWIDVWDMPDNVLKYYMFFLSKLSAASNGHALPVTDAEVSEKTGASPRVVGNARRACEQARLIERVHDLTQPRGVYLYKLPESISSQGQTPRNHDLETVPESGNEPQIEYPNQVVSTENTLPKSGTQYPNTVITLPKSGNEDSEPKAPEATPPQASEPVAQDLRLFLDLNLDILDSIRDMLIFNTEQKNGKYMSVRAKESMGKELVEKLYALTQEFCEYDAGDVLIVCRGLAEEKEYRSPWMYRTENHGVMEDIREELEGAQGRAITRRGDTLRKSKRDVPDEIIIKWIDAMAEEKQFVEMKRVGGNYEAVLEERTEEEKQDLRDTLSAAHDEGELDYHEIWGWNERGGTEINRSETTLRSNGIIYHGAQNKNGFHSLGDVLKEAAARNGDSS